MTQTIIKVPAAGAFDPTDIELTDNTSGALLIKEGSNEYMRIDTTNGSEKTIFKTQSGANTGFFVNAPAVGDVLSIVRGGSPATKALLNVGTLSFQVDSGQILNDLVSDSNTFKVDGTNVAPLTITGDSNATFTLDSGNSAVFKVQDDAGTPTEYMKIDTTSGAELTKFVVHDDGVNDNNFIVSTDRSNSSLINVTPRNTGLGNAEGVFFNGSSSTQVWVSGPSIFRLQNCSLIHNMTGSQNATTYLGTAADWIVTRGSPSEEMIKFEHDSNMTFTLDDGSGATFKVVDNNATPKTYLSITESTQSFGADPYVHKVTMGDNNRYFNLGPNVLRANAMSGGATALYGPASYMYSQSQITITTNQTYGDFDPCQTPYTMTMGAGATGNVTVDSGFTVRGDYQAGSTPKQSYPVLWVFQNDNATHNFILSFDGGATGLEHTKSGDTDAAALISAGGLTLTPGQRYIVRFQKITNELLLIESVDKH